MSHLKAGTLVRWLGLGLMLGVLATWAFADLDLQVTLNALQSADTLKIFVYVPLLILAVWLLRAVRWALVLRAAGARMNPLSIYLSTTTSLGLAAVTPAQSGELLKIKHAANASQIGLLGGFGGFAAERFYDVLILLVLTILATMFAAKPGSFTVFGVVGVGSVIAAALMLNLIPTDRLPTSVIGLLEGFRSSTRRPVVAIELTALTIACWFVSALLWQVTMSAVGVDVPFAAAMAIVGIATFAGVASTIPGGLGVSEVTVSGLLIVLGFGPEQALSAALILRFISLWIVVLGLVHWGVLRSRLNA